MAATNFQFQRGRRDAESATWKKLWTMYQRRHDAIRHRHTHLRFPPPWVLVMLIFSLPLISATKSYLKTSHEHLVASPDIQEGGAEAIDVIHRAERSRSVKREAKKDFTPPRWNDDTSFDPETATFSPDEVLVDFEKIRNEAPLNGPASEEVTYVTEEELEKLRKMKHQPIRPLMVNPGDLPAEVDSEYETIPHILSKSPKRVDPISRKLFVRNDTDSKYSKVRRGVIDIPIKDHNNFSFNKKTVKKELRKSLDGEYRVLDGYQAEAATGENTITDSLPFPKALTRYRSTRSESGINSKLKRERPDPKNEAVAHIADDMTVEEFKIHLLQNEKWGNRPPPTSVDQRRKILNQYKTRDDNDHLDHKTEGIIEDSLSYGTAKESEKNVIPNRVSLDEDKQDVPVALNVRRMTSGSESNRQKKISSGFSKHRFNVRRQF